MSSVLSMDLIQKMIDKMNLRNIGYSNASFLLLPGGYIELTKWVEKSNLHFGNIDVLEEQEKTKAELLEKDYKLVGEDILGYETLTEYDCIIANLLSPNAFNQLTKVAELAEKQICKDCQMVCLLESEMIKNLNYDEKQLFQFLMTKYEGEVEFESELGEFAIVSLKKLKPSNQNSYLDKMITYSNQSEANEHALIIPDSNNGEYKVEDIISLVKLYQEHVKRLKAACTSLTDLDMFEEYVWDRKNIRSYHGFERLTVNLYDSLEGLRLKYWEKILKTEKFDKVLTSRARQELQKKLNSLGSVEITTENIYTMLVSLSQNQTNIFTEALELFFDNVTSHNMREFSKNTHYYNGWTTNDAFKINKKIIIPVYGESYYYRWERNGFEDCTWSVKEQINDTLKILSLVTPTPAGEWNQIGDYEFENNLLRFKLFKKGTLHIWFKDLQALAKLNYLVGQAKKWLPSEEEIEEDGKAKNFVKKEFPELNSFALEFKGS